MITLADLRTKFTNLGSAARAMGPYGVAAKAVGVVGIGVALYDAHKYAKLKAYDNRRTKDADAAADYFNNTQYLDNKSHTTSKMKKMLFDWELTNTLRGAVNATTGYIGGFASGLFKHIVPVAASVGAIYFGGKKSYAAAGALGLWGVMSTIRHTFSHTDHKL